MSHQPRDRKTEEPTDRRLRHARQDGGTPFSRDVSTVAVLLAALGYLWFARAQIQAQLSSLGRYALEAPSRLVGMADGKAIIDIAIEVMIMLAWLCLPVATTCAIVALAVNLAQVRGLFAPKAIVPKGERINPVEGAKRIFSLRSAVELGKSLFKVLALGLTLFLLIRWAIPNMVKMPSLDIDGVMSVSGIVFAIFFSLACAILMIIAVFDYWFQHLNFIRDNKMTREEVKRERRDDQGDPHLRAERRKRSAELANESALERTARASVVIHAPASKVAVAVFIDRDPDITPWLLNKGSGHVAAAILSVARKNQVRIVQDARLALALARHVVVEQDVPKEYTEPLRAIFE